MANETVTLASDLIVPEVMADMISAKIDKKIVVAPFAKIDTTLVGVPGDTITVPQYAYIGDAADVAEGVADTTVKLTTGTTSVKVKKAMKSVELTDEAVLSGYGNPVGETNSQIALAIAAKVDNDALTALGNAQLSYDGSAAVIGYTPIVEAVGVFAEEVNSEKVMFVHPAQTTQLRKDADFISADKYPGNVIMSGEIGMIANCRIVPSKKVVSFATWYYFVTSGTSGKLTIVASGGNNSSTVDLTSVTPTLPNAIVGDYVKLSSIPVYVNPIVKLNNDVDSEDDAAAITIYLKQDTTVETSRVALSQKTDIVAAKHYAAALSNTAKVVLAKIAQLPAVVEPEPTTNLADIAIESVAGAATNGSVITLSPAAGDGNSFVRALGTAFVPFAPGVTLSEGWTAITSGADIACSTNTHITVAEVTAAGVAVGRGVALLVKKSAG